MSSWSSLSSASRRPFPILPVSQLNLFPFTPPPSPAIHVIVVTLVSLWKFEWWVPCAVGTWCNLFASSVITGTSFQYLAQHILSEEYFPHSAPLLCPLLLPLPHRELQWEGKLDLVWPWPRAHLSRQVSRKSAFRNSSMAHNHCNCLEVENQLPILLMEVGCSTHGCPREQTGEKRGSGWSCPGSSREQHCWHRLYSKPVSPTTAPVTLQLPCLFFSEGLRYSVLQLFRDNNIFQWCSWLTSTDLAPQCWS